MKSIANSFRSYRQIAIRGLPSSAHDLFTVIAQGITVLRIAVLVLVLLVKFKLEQMLDRKPD